MKIVLIDGNPDTADEKFTNYVNDYAQELKQSGAEVVQFTLRDMDINFCDGCWTCWWKTPGKCVFTDDAVEIYPEMVACDKLIFFSPLSMGYVSSLIKKFHDRSIPVLHPYTEIVDGEFHHRKRYEKYPLLGVVVKPEPDTDEEDLQIVHDLYKRYALNFRSSLDFFRVMEVIETEEVLSEAHSV